ncbi:MAG: PHP domain-containing protein, partial [Candidatus Omnitrophica bacterium]|nr:PHP domain-containing protein [Candidatus Omnitrophota bacterium]
MARSDFVHLHVHSQYSLLDGACQLPQLVERAVQMEMPAVCLTDHGNIFGAIEFYLLARQKGIKPIIGCETYVSATSRFTRGDPHQKSLFYHLTLLIKNEQGYRNLLRLISIANSEGFYYKPRIDGEVLARHAAGLVGLSGCLKGEIAALLLAGRSEQATQRARELASLFEPESFFLEVMDHGLPEQKKVNPLLRRLSEETGIPLVATNDVHYLKKEMARAHEILLCLQTQTTLADPNHMRMSAPEFYFKSPEEMRALFADMPEALHNTLRVAEMCTLELNLHKTHLPTFKVPAGITDIEFLRRECAERLRA